MAGCTSERHDGRRESIARAGGISALVVAARSASASAMSDVASRDQPSIGLNRSKKSCRCNAGSAEYDLLP
ncbi:hypothetical protein WN72_33150 [Bradyrhizobium arachidis]|uniref:Uncharacterized protein n=1 Tax=Bradyrhizobium arachidis TaxID=858423 RepID=A0AAE7TJH8_9BRAD|nr:hypothetical protein WN72_33150 [Bradyrhizobium arachidis]